MGQDQNCYFLAPFRNAISCIQHPTHWIALLKTWFVSKRKHCLNSFIYERAYRGSQFCFHVHAWNFACIYANIVRRLAKDIHSHPNCADLDKRSKPLSKQVLFQHRCAVPTRRGWNSTPNERKLAVKTFALGLQNCVLTLELGVYLLCFRHLAQPQNPRLKRRRCGTLLRSLSYR